MSYALYFSYLRSEVVDCNSHTPHITLQAAESAGELIERVGCGAYQIKHGLILGVVVTCDSAQVTIVVFQGISITGVPQKVVICYSQTSVLLADV